jgi:hypothetical protein
MDVRVRFPLSALVPFFKAYLKNRSDEKPRRCASFALRCSVVLVVEGCSVLTGNCRRRKNFARCEFRLATVENITLAGINVQRIKSTRDLTLSRRRTLRNGTHATATAPEPDAQCRRQNPNAETASLNRLEWRLFIDEVEFASTDLSKRKSACRR